MRYLKAFESFDNDEVIDYVKDILIELKDVGVSYNIKTYDDSLFIRMTRDTNVYRWREVEPFIEHLISYLSEHDFKLNEEESTKDLLKSWDNRPFNYLEVRFDLVKKESNWKKLFNKKKYTTLDLRNGEVYVKYSGKDLQKMKSVLIDAFGSSFVTDGNMMKDKVYYAKSKHTWDTTTTKTSKLDKPVVSELDIDLSTKRVYESRTRPVMMMKKVKDIKYYIKNYDILDDVWLNMDEYLDNTNTTTNQDINGKVSLKLIQINKEDRRRDYQIPKLVVQVLLLNKEGIDLSAHRGNGSEMMYAGHTQCTVRDIDIMKEHSCYQELIDSHERTLELINGKDFKFIPMESARDPWTSGTNKDSIYFEIHYELVEQYLDCIYDRIYSMRDSDSKYYYDLVKDKENFKDHEVVRGLKSITEKGKIKREFSDVWRDLLTYGFKYDHVIEKARKIDISNAIMSGVDESEAFFMMGILGDYETINQFTRSILGHFNFTESSSNNLGYDLLNPFFEFCLKQTEWFWDESDKKLAPLYLVFNREYLSILDSDCESRDFWISYLSESFTRLAVNLIALNRKESTEWLVQLLKSVETPSENDIKSIKEFIRSLELYKSRVKSKVGLSTGLFKELPDYDFFESKIEELKEYINQ